MCKLQQPSFQTFISSPFKPAVVNKSFKKLIKRNKKLDGLTLKMKKLWQPNISTVNLQLSSKINVLDFSYNIII